MESAGIAVSVAPSQSAYFAGEDFSVTITFTNLNEPSTSYAHHFRQPHTATAATTTFAPTHRRGAQSVAYPANIPHTPRTASSVLNVAALPDESPLAHQQQVDSPTPRRRGFIGKGKQREVTEESSPPESTGPPSPVAQFKRKHAPKSLSVSSFVSEELVSPRTRLPKLDTGQPDSPLVDCELCCEYQCPGCGS